MTRLRERYDIWAIRYTTAYVWTQLCHLVRDNGFYCRQHGKNIERMCGEMARLWPFDREARMKNWSDPLRSRLPRRSPWSADSRSHCCGHTGSLAWVTSSIPHIIPCDTRVTYSRHMQAHTEARGKKGEMYEWSWTSCVLYTHYNVRWCAGGDRREGYALAWNITPRLASVANYPSNTLRALPQIAK